MSVTGFMPGFTVSDMPMPTQIILLILVHLGGVGIMGVTTFLAMITGARLGVKGRLFAAGELGVDSPMDIGGVLWIVFGYTIVLEIIGALLLYMKFTEIDESQLMAVYHSLFFSINGFCSGGFSFYHGGLAGLRSTFIIPAVLMILMTTGGLGFPVLAELRALAYGRVRFLSPYAKIVLAATAIFTTIGTVVLMLLEWNDAFSDMTLMEKFWNALFTSISARGGGFATFSYGDWSQEGLAVLMLFMFIGAAPSSTAGGIKITTFAVLLCAALSELKNQEDVVIYGRRITPFNIRRALTLAFIYMVTIFLAVTILSKIEDIPFTKLAFETVSALGTAGLTSGITSSLSVTGKMVLVLLMLWGRVGILTFCFSLVRRDTPENVHYPETNIPIG
ncbi:potassium transporter Trk [Synergistales bacterium]|nr:potassium transporter Trk [Synergistales bacterium]